MTVPYTFGTATTSIPLSNLDANFNTPITLGNTSIYLGNTTTTIGNLTLTNATISSGTVNITNVTVTTANVTNITVTGTANIATGNVTTLTSTSITDSGLTSGRVTYAGASGLLSDSSGLTFDGTIFQVKTGNTAATQFRIAHSSAANFYADYNEKGDLTVGRNSWSAGVTTVFSTTSATSTYTDDLSGGFSFSPRGSLAVTIAGTGRVGIGTSSPSALLGITNSTMDSQIVLGVNSTATDYGCISLNGNLADTTRLGITGGGTGDNNLYIDVPSSGGFKFRIGATSSMTLDASGNLLVGATTSGVSNGGMQLLPAGNGASIPLIASSGNSSSNAEVTMAVYSTSAAQYQFYVGYAGTVFARSIVISALSDARLKENIVDLDVGIDAIMALKPRKFDWKDGQGTNKKNVRGFIAQELEEVFPDLIDEWRDPAPEGEEPYRSVRQDLMPVLVKAIQEQQALIESLTTRLTALENK